MQFVGGGGAANPLHLRMNGHRSNYHRRLPDKPVTKHFFNTVGHAFEDATVTIIKQLHSADSTRRKYYTGRVTGFTHFGCSLLMALIYNCPQSRNNLHPGQTPFFELCYCSLLIPCVSGLAPYFLPSAMWWGYEEFRPNRMTPLLKRIFPHKTSTRAIPIDKQLKKAISAETRFAVKNHWRTISMEGLINCTFGSSFDVILYCFLNTAKFMPK